MLNKLSDNQHHFLLRVISMHLFLTYMNTHGLDLNRICDTKEYTNKEKTLLLQLRNDYIKNELPIKQKWTTPTRPNF
jgi:hypothetical protein